MRRIIISLLTCYAGVVCAMPPMPNSLYVGAHGGAAIPGGGAQHSLQTGYLVGGELGYRFDRIRMEGQVTYIQNHPSLGPRWTDNTMGYLGNLYYDIPVSDSIMPYFGAGMGLVQQWLSLPSSSTSNLFGFQFLTGLGFNVTSQCMLDFRYRYLGNTTNKAATNGLEFGINYTFA